MNDSYNHKNTNVFYVEENILGPEEESTEYENLLRDYNSQLTQHCQCGGVCTLGTCDCIQKSGSENYTTYYENGNVKYKLNNKREPIYECNGKCSCSNDCSNRVVQRGPLMGLEIKSNDKGLGLYTTHFVPEGTFICEYAGELLTTSQAAIRHDTNLTHGEMNYIFCLKEHSGGSVVKMFVDPSVFGNIGRYINHSCEPNCFIVPVRCDSPVPKLAIFACVDILPSNELTFHYGSGDICDFEEFGRRIRCLCKSDSCTGFMPFHKY